MNTGRYWDETYKGEIDEQKLRIDEERCGLLFRWLDQRASELTRAAKLLDIGCGWGELGLYLKTAPRDERKFTYCGVDVSEIAIEHAKFRLPGTDLRAAEFEAVPYSWDAFDVLWCGETLEHFEQPLRALARMYEIAGDGAFLILSTPYRGRNRNDEHNWEFEPSDVIAWAQAMGELAFLDTTVCGGLSMFAVIRVAKEKEPS